MFTDDIIDSYQICKSARWIYLKLQLDWPVATKTKEQRSNFGQILVTCTSCACAHITIHFACIHEVMNFKYSHPLGTSFVWTIENGLWKIGAVSNQAWEKLIKCFMVSKHTGPFIHAHLDLIWDLSLSHLKYDRDVPVIGAALCKSRNSSLIARVHTPSHLQSHAQ